MTFQYKKEEFPSKKFDDSTQIGWVADEVEEIAPELVYRDADGYRGVAYARACPIVAEAVKEMHREFQAELNLVKQELRQLKEEYAQYRERGERVEE